MTTGAALGRVTPRPAPGLAAVRVIAVGHPDAGDDAAGPLALASVAARAGPGIALVHCEGDPMEMIEAWEGAELAVVVDAMVSGAPPGTVARFEVTDAPLPAHVRAPASTHGIGVHEVIELARALGRLPRRLVVWAIEAADASPGAGASRAVLAGIERAAAAIARECQPH